MQSYNIKPENSLSLPHVAASTQVLHYTELDPKERADPMAVVFPKVRRRGKICWLLKVHKRILSWMLTCLDSLLLPRNTLHFFEEIFMQLRELSVFRFCTFLKYLFLGFAAL